MRFGLPGRNCAGHSAPSTGAVRGILDASSLGGRRQTRYESQNLDQADGTLRLWRAPRRGPRALIHSQRAVPRSGSRNMELQAKP